MVTNAQLALAVIIVGLWCGGNLTAAFVLALLNRRA